MKSYVKHLICVSLMVFTTATLANNIRVIGKGGGIDEMEALTFFDQIPVVIQFCLSGKNLCALTPVETALLFSASENKTSSPRRLSFKSEDAKPILLADLTLQVSSNDLSYASIFSSYVTAALGGGEFSKDSAAKIFDQQKIRIQSLGLKRDSGDQSTVMIQAIRGVFGAQISARQEDQVTEIQWQLSDALSCSGLNDVRVAGIEKLSREGFGFTATVLWVCGGAGYRGKIIARRDLRSSQLDFEFRVFNKELVECGAWLK